MKSIILIPIALLFLIGWDEEGNITKTEIWKNGELVK